MSSSDEDAGDSLFGDFFVNKSYANAALTFGEDGPAQRTLRLRVSTAACTDHDLTGQTTWPGARLLARFLAAQPDAFFRDCACELGAGTGLAGLYYAARGGDVLVAQDGSLVRVIAAPQPVLVIRHCTEHGTPFDLTRAAYHLGNRHVPIELKPDHLKIEPDHVLADMLRAMHLIVNEALEAFEPEGGAYASHGGQGRSHSHSHHSNSHLPADLESSRHVHPHPAPQEHTHDNHEHSDDGPDPGPSHGHGHAHHQH